MQQPGMQEGAGTQLRVEEPVSEEVLSNFELFLTPSQEIMGESEMLMQQLTNPEQFREWVNERVQRPDGITALSAAFSNVMSRGEAMQLAMVLNEAFGQQQQQQPLAAQTGVTGTTQQYNPPFTAYTLAIIDLIARRDVENAGQAIYWALSGAGGEDLARSTVATLDTLQAQFGCSEPFRTALQSAGEFANMQMTSPPGGQQAEQADPSNFITWITQSPPLMACFQEAYPDFQMLMQQAQEGGMAGTQPTGITGEMPGQP